MCTTRRFAPRALVDSALEHERHLIRVSVRVRVRVRVRVGVGVRVRVRVSVRVRVRVRARIGVRVRLSGALEQERHRIALGGLVGTCFRVRV